MVPKRIIWHHSADGAQRPQFDKINAYHKTLQFPVSSLGFYVGYHWLIEYDGSIRQARPETEIGAHDTGENLNSIGICLAGDFNVSLPNERQTQAVCWLVGEIRKRWPIPLTRIEPHRWDDQTDCPGQKLTDEWLAREYLKRSGDTLLNLYLWLGERYGLL